MEQGSELQCWRVLIVDDEVDCAEVLADALQMKGYATRIAFDATTALALGALFIPHAAVLDLGLPDADGCELARRMRAASWGHAMRLVALTGSSGLADRVRSAEAGFDVHLVKPAELEVVFAALQRRGSEAAPRFRGVAPLPPARPDGPKRGTARTTRLRP